MRREFNFAVQGGLNEVQQPLLIDPGQAIAALNHEAVNEGYARVHGYERFDGRTSPTDFPFYIIEFFEGATQVNAGDTVTGVTSGATGIALTDAILGAGEWDGSGAGIIGLRAMSGTFQPGEDLQVGGFTVATANGAQYTGVAGSGNADEQRVAVAAIEYARDQIDAVPGSGPVRGVVYFSGNLYAFRDNAGGTAGAVHRSTASGWQAVTLGKTLDFTAGSEILVGDTIVGATSGASGIVERVVVQTGSFGAGTAEGYLVLSGGSGTFTNETLNIAGSPVATIEGSATTITLPAGGAYRFIAHNFYGASNLRRVYGVNGVGNGFEFDGTVLSPIRTGMPVDAPNRVAVFQNQLFFAFPGGSVQHSAPTEPLTWNAILGAAEIGVGSDVSDFISQTAALIILTADGVWSLIGTGVADWQLNALTLEAGALAHTGQRFGPGIYLDNRGLRSIGTTQNYGNFMLGTLTQAIKETLRQKSLGGVRPCASAIFRAKDQYRLFYDDGSGLSFYMGRKNPEPMYFEYPHLVTCITSAEDEFDDERIFFGSDDGFVYEMERGTSFDGGEIEAYCQFPYAHMGSPNLIKRVHKIKLECLASAGTQVGMTVEYDYSSNEQPRAAQGSVTARGTGALYGVGSWGEFNWSSPVENVLSTHIDGQGRNASIITYSKSAEYSPYVLRGGTFFYSVRGSVR